MDFACMGTAPFVLLEGDLQHYRNTRLFWPFNLLGTCHLTTLLSGLKVDLMLHDHS
jgi:hypothetical protein